MSGYNSLFSNILIETCKQKMHTLVQGLVTDIAHEAEVDKRKLLEVWNEIAPEYCININPAPGSDTKIPGTICGFVFPRSNRNCSKAISTKSKSGMYCSTHAHIDDKKHEDECAKCEYKFKLGRRAGQVCNSNVSKNSATGKYCGTHLKNEQKPSKRKTGEHKMDVSVSSKTDTVFSPVYDEKLKTFVDRKSGYIFNDGPLGEVYGKIKKINGDDILYPLSYDDKNVLNVCEHPYDDNLLYIKFPEKLLEIEANDSDCEDDAPGGSDDSGDSDDSDSSDDSDNDD